MISKVSVVLKAILLFSIICTHPGNAGMESDPSVSQFSFIRGDGDPGFTGDLTFSLPLMTVPGRGGLNFDIKLNYVTGGGVPAKQNGAWVGLGWNLTAGQITCSPAMAKEDSIDVNILTYVAWDQFFLTMPDGMATEIVQFDDKWYPVNWSAIKIDTAINRFSDTYVTEYKEFVIRGVDGTRYVYKEDLRRERTINDWNDVLYHKRWATTGRGYSTVEDNTFTYVIKISEILSPDYVDSDATDGPSDGDKGSWIKFEYSTDETVTLTAEEYSMNYLSKIITPTHKAVFTTTSTNSECVRDAASQNLSSEVLESLSSIKLFEKDASEGTNSNIIKEIVFSYSNSFDWYTSNLNYNDNKRRRLNSITEYGKGGQSTGSHFPSIKFSYNGNPNLPLDSTGTYKRGYGDYWGYITSQSDHSPESTYIKSWLLNKVTYPSGEYVRFYFEPDQFVGYDDCPISGWEGQKKTGGGVRLAKKTVYHSSSDSSVYTYDYAQNLKSAVSSYYGYGFLSGINYANDDEYEPLEDPGTNYASMGLNYNSDVHYPDVTITFPDGSEVTRYYTNAASGLPSNLHYIYYTTSSDQQITTSNYGYLDYVKDRTRVNPFACAMATYMAPASDRTAFYTKIQDLHDWHADTTVGTSDVYITKMNNNWKRGFVYKEQYKDSSGSMVKEIKNYYDMDPLHTTQSVVLVGELVGGHYCFTNSGWVQKKQEKIYTHGQNSTGWFSNDTYYYYNSNNGLIDYTQEYNNDNTTRNTKNYYVFDNHFSEGALADSFEIRNMLSQKSAVAIFDTTSMNYQTSGTLLKMQKTTWADFDATDHRYYIDKKEIWLDDDDDQNVDSGEWVQVEDQTSYDSYGNLLEIKDANNTFSTMIYDYNNSLPVATIINAQEGECGHMDLENGFGDWETGGGSTQSSTQAFTGKYSAYCNDKYGPTKNFYAANGIDKTKIYVADAWVYRVGGTATISIDARNSSDSSVAVGGAAYSVVSSGTGWQYIRVEIDPDRMANLPTDGYLRLWCGFKGTSYSGYVDNVRFYPLEAIAQTQAYDEVTLFKVAAVDASNMPRKITYDNLGRIDIIKDFADNTLYDNDYFFSRDTYTDYNTSYPNYIQSKTYVTGSDYVTQRTFYDASNREIQNQIDFGDSVIVSAKSYNPMSKVQYAYRPQIKHNTLLAYLSSFTTGNSNYEEYDYFAEPTSRIKTLKHHDDTNSQITYAYEKQSFVTSTNYLNEKVTNEEGIVSKSFNDFFGRNVGKSITISSPNQSYLFSHHYDRIDNLTINRPPNYYGSTGTQSNTSYNTDFEYNTIGHLLERDGADGGITSFIYDNLGNMRYKQDAYQAAGSRYDFTAYHYDAQNRLKTVGEEKDFNWTSSTKPATSSSNYGTDADEWKIKHYYDTDYTSTSDNYCQGRLTKTEINTDSDSNPEHIFKYVYDQYGNVTDEYIEIFDGDSVDEKVIRYEYDLMGRITQITYPSGNVITRYYDDAGRLEKLFCIDNN